MPLAAGRRLPYRRLRDRRERELALVLKDEAQAAQLHEPARDHGRVPGVITRQGDHVRSRAEVRIAGYFDALSLRYEYEKEIEAGFWCFKKTVGHPDFYLPEEDAYIELTTLRQSLVRRKNRKLRRLRELYPMLNVKLLYARDFRALLVKYGRGEVADRLMGTDGQPGRETVIGIAPIIVPGAAPSAPVPSIPPAA